MIREIIDTFRGFFVDTEKKIGELAEKVERSFARRGYRLKRFLFRSSIELFVLIFGLGILLLGVLLFLTKFIRLDVLAIVTGLLMVNAALLFGKFR